MMDGARGRGEWMEEKRKQRYCKSTFFFRNSKTVISPQPVTHALKAVITLGEVARWQSGVV